MHTYAYKKSWLSINETADCLIKAVVFILHEPIAIACCLRARCWANQVDEL